MKKDSQGNTPKKKKKKFLQFIGDSIGDIFGLHISTPKAEEVIGNIQRETEYHKENPIKKDCTCTPSAGFQKDKTRRHYAKKKRMRLYGKQ